MCMCLCLYCARASVRLFVCAYNRYNHFARYEFNCDTYTRLPYAITDGERHWHPTLFLLNENVRFLMAHTRIQCLCLATSWLSVATRVNVCFFANQTVNRAKKRPIKCNPKKGSVKYRKSNCEWGVWKLAN